MLYLKMVVLIGLLECLKTGKTKEEYLMKPLTLKELTQRLNGLSKIVRTSNKIYKVKGVLKNE